MKEEMESKYRIVKSDLDSAMNCLNNAAEILSNGFLIDNVCYKHGDILSKSDEILDCYDYVNGRIFNAISNM